MYCKSRYLVLTFLFALFALLPAASVASESTNVNMKDDQVIAARGYWGGRGYHRGDGYYGRGFHRVGFRDGWRGGYYYSSPGYGYGYGYGPYYSGYGGYGFGGGYGHVRFGGGYGYGGYCSSCGGGFLFGF